MVLLELYLVEEKRSSSSLSHLLAWYALRRGSWPSFSLDLSLWLPLSGSLEGKWSQPPPLVVLPPPRAGGAPGAFISQARGTKVNEVACRGSLVAR